MRKETRIEKHFAYVLSIALFLIGITLISISYLIPSNLVSLIVRGFGLAFCPSGAIAFIFEFYIQERWAQDLKKSLESDITVVSDKLGIKRIYKNRDEWDVERLNLYHRAKNVSYLAVSPNLPPPYNDDKMIDKFLELLREGVSFKFLVCDPENPFATQYYGYQRKDSPVEEFSQGIWKNIERLKRVKEENGGPGKIEIRIYNTSPGCYMQIIDDRVFFQPYLYGSPGQTPFMLEVEERGQRGIFNRHFQIMWKEAISIDEFWCKKRKDNTENCYE